MQTKRFGLCAALSAAALLLLAGCAGSGSTAAPTLTVESSYPLQYAKQFTVDECTGGYELITIADSQYLVVPQGLNTKVLPIAQIYQAIAATPTIRVNNAFKLHTATNHSLESGF